MVAGELELAQVVDEQVADRTVFDAVAVDQFLHADLALDTEYPGCGRRGGGKPAQGVQ